MKRTAPRSPTINAAGRAIVGNSGVGIEPTVTVTSLLGEEETKDAVGVLPDALAVLVVVALRVVVAV